MSSINTNLLANLLGKAWSGLISLVLLPVYLRLVGPEAYGLVGFYATLLGTMSILDLGLTTTLSRELAHQSHPGEGAERSRNLLRTLELFYWLAAAAMILGMVLWAPVIAGHWLKASHLVQATVRHAVVLMGAVIAMQMLASFYLGGIFGLQQQVRGNIVAALFATLRAVGAVGVLTWGSASILSFFSWQLIAAAGFVVSARTTLWRLMPRSRIRPHIDFAVARSALRFAGGLSVISIAGLLLAQTDKIILSRSLTLAAFGYYSLAASLGGSLQYFGNPIYTAFFPAFARTASSGDIDALAQLYLRASQLTAIAVLPLAGVLAIFPSAVLALWTHGSVYGADISLLVALLSVAAALNVVVSIPYALQLAHGWTQLAVRTNTLAALFVVPTLIWAIARYGAPGAAGVSVALNLGYLAVYATLMHQRLLIHSRTKWLDVAFARPVLAVTAAGYLIHIIAGRRLPPLALVSVAFLTMTATVAAVLPAAREVLGSSRSLWVRLRGPIVLV